MAANKDQPQAVVVNLLFFPVWNGRLELVDKFHQGRIEPGASPHGIDSPETTGGNQPGSGIGRHAIPWPLLSRRGEGVVQRLLRDIEIAEQTNQGGEDTTRVGSIDSLHNVTEPLDGVLAHA